MQKISSLSIKWKVFGFASIAMLFLLLSGAIGYHSLNRSIESSAALTKNEYPKVLLVQRLKADSHALMRFLWTTHGLYQYAGERKNQINEAIESFKSLESDLKKTQQIKFPAELQKTVQEIYKRWADLSVSVPKIISLYEKGTEEADKAATNTLAFEVVPQANEIYDYLKELDIKLQADILNQTNISEKNTQQLKSIIIITIASSFVILIGFSILFNSKLSGKMMKVAADLKNAAEQTEQSSGDVKNASNSVAQSSQEQASAIQETLTTLDEFTSMLQLSSRNAEQSMDFSLKSKDAADEGKEVVKKVIESIVEIKESNNRVLIQTTEGNKKIQEIVSVINEISEKTKVINDIVFQTKLLSFNASVEAARAGEHGKGFAVVAEEVGNLAVMSGNAAQEIFNMLESSIAKTQSIVSHTQAEIENLMKESSLKIETGIKIAGACDVSLDKIVENVNQVNTLVNEVVSAAKEQEIGVQQISNAMIEIDKSTNFNTQTSNETLTCAEGLITQSKELMRIVSELELEVYGS